MALVDPKTNRMLNQLTRVEAPMTSEAEAKAAEIDRNLSCFLEALPSLLPDHADEYALIRGGNVLDFYGSALDAQIAGNRRFEDRLFSIQRVEHVTEELGYYTYAIDQRQA